MRALSNTSNHVPTNTSPGSFQTFNELQDLDSQRHNRDRPTSGNEVLLKKTDGVFAVGSAKAKPYKLRGRQFYECKRN
jgi:hypothetical protein